MVPAPRQGVQILELCMQNTTSIHHIREKLLHELPPHQAFYGEWLNLAASWPELRLDLNQLYTSRSQPGPCAQHDRSCSTHMKDPNSEFDDPWLEVLDPLEVVGINGACGDINGSCQALSPPLLSAINATWYVSACKRSVHWILCNALALLYHLLRTCPYLPHNISQVV